MFWTADAQEKHSVVLPSPSLHLSSESWLVLNYYANISDKIHF